MSANCEHAYGRHCADPDCRVYICHKCRHEVTDHYCGEGAEIPHAFGDLQRLGYPRASD